MKMFWYYVPAIIFVMTCVSILAVQCIRSARQKSRWEVSWVAIEPVLALPEPSAEPVEEVDPVLEAWIAAELEKDFVEEGLSKEAPPSEPVTPKRMVLNDMNTGMQTDLSIDALFGKDGEEVTDINQALSVAGRDDTGRWWAVDLREFSWEIPTIH